LYQGIIENNIEDFSPRSVFIHKKVGDTIVFNFKSKQSLNRIILSSRKQKQLYLTDTPERTRDGYRYVYRIEKQGVYDLQIDLLFAETNRTYNTIYFKTYTDIIYWVNAN